MKQTRVKIRNKHSSFVKHKHSFYNNKKHRTFFNRYSYKFYIEVGLSVNQQRTLDKPTYKISLNMQLPVKQVYVKEVLNENMSKNVYKTNVVMPISLKRKTIVIYMYYNEFTELHYNDLVGTKYSRLNHNKNAYYTSITVKI